MSSLNVSQLIRRAISNENYDFNKVILDVADGFKLCGFFDKPNWNKLLVQCFEQKRLGLTNQEIEIYTSVLSESSYEAVFVNGLVAESTPIAPAPVEKESRTSRYKRCSTQINDGTPTSDARKKLKKTTNSMADMEVAKILLDLKNGEWTRLVPTANAKQEAVDFVNIFERSKQLRQGKTVTQNVTSHRVTVQQTVNAVGEKTASPRIVKRRNAYRPPAKQSADPVTPQPVSSEQPAADPVPNVSNTAKSAKPKSLDGGVKPTVPGIDAVLTNITNRRTTRRQTQLLAAYSGSSSGNRSERRSTGCFRRTSVLFTMIDVERYKDVLQTYNIFVADSNEIYDCLIVEKICRSPKFLSAVVSGKPIISIDWLHALKEQKTWLDPLEFLLKDEEGEKQYNFSLSHTLQLATNQKLFCKYSIAVTPNTPTGPKLLKDVIFSGGGKFLKTTLVPRKGDEVLCVSDEVDKEMWPVLQKKYPTLKRIISLEGFTNMIFQYNVDVSQSCVLHQI